MVPFDFGIENNRVGRKVQLAQQAFLDEQIERVVDSGARDHRKAIADAVPDAIGGGMIVGGQNILCDRHTMRRRMDAVPGEDFYDIDSQTRRRLCRTLDDVKS